MCGCNIVRFHQLDAEWNTPNIFQFAKGRRHGTRELDAESMDRLDYLICCLKAEGIYCYLDLLTYRKFKTLDGVDNAIALQDAAKPYCIFDRHLIDLQKEYATQLWRHFNPYTRLAYCDDPVFVLCEIVNETDLYSGVNCALRAEPYVTRFREGFAAWLKEKGADGDAATCDINQNSPLVTEYKMQLSQAYYREMHKHLRSLGVRIPITGTNWTRESAILKDNLCDMDFTDSHYYVYDWRWGEDEKFCTARSISESPVTGFAKPAKMRSFDKPFFLSEWDMPWPNPYRAESPIFYAAINNLQDWCGMAIHTYAYSTGLDNMKLLGKEFSSDSIGKIPYREGIFSTWNDPAKFGLFYHAALIVRRGDIAPAKTKIACNITALDKTVHGAMQLGVECNQVASCFDGIAPDADRIVDEAEEYLHPGADGIVSDTGELYRNPKKSYGIINSPRYQVRLRAAWRKGRSGNGYRLGAGRERFCRGCRQLPFRFGDRGKRQYAAHRRRQSPEYRLCGGRRQNRLLRSRADCRRGDLRRDHNSDRAAGSLRSRHQRRGAGGRYARHTLGRRSAYLPYRCALPCRLLSDSGRINQKGVGQT